MAYSTFTVPLKDERGFGYAEVKLFDPCLDCEQTGRVINRNRDRVVRCPLCGGRGWRITNAGTTILDLIRIFTGPNPNEDVPDAVAGYR